MKLYVLNVILYVLGIGGYYGAVEMIAGLLEFIPLIE